ncbi:glycerol-3-phosphate 1-O-acyltransferase PlsY [Salinispira pacifica]|uniref:Glycerol-3-phosphate acyltransferase n=1 Tax=Salinispira pacifica TaxID=1307761 RepID=V5WN53_9SPIO|nr:glycerol-3-phosphate 1-O-acyltransferase PlsY [Salinispira pacifica]AHC16619.1 Acyl-phosphate:glycerol-3-phosphate O-acyltransferase PlsY [Salinispira pacifica]
MLMIVGVIVVGYLVGSFPTSVIAVRVLKGADIRDLGSGNAGATNTVRVLGARWGIIVGLVDLAKGWLAITIARAAGMPDYVLVLSGLAAVAGHAFPLFARFKGGKGVATGAGMVLGLFPLAFLVCLGGFLGVLFLSGIVSISSITAAILLPPSVYFLGGGKAAFETGDAVGIGIWLFSLALGIFVIVLHRKNIRRLIKGEERRFEKISILHRLNAARKRSASRDDQKDSSAD